MATQKPDQFDQVDWDDMTRSGWFDLSLNAKLTLVTTVPLALLFLYDWQFVGEREVVFEELGNVLGLGSVFETVGLTFGLSPIDYGFIFALLLFSFYLVLPLYQNPRMTKYYWKEFKRNRPAVLSLVWLTIVFVGGIVGPVFVARPELDVLAAYQPPAFYHINDANVATCLGEVANGRCHGTWEHPLGTTPGGKDVFGMLVYGMLVTAKIAFVTTTIVAIFGIAMGTVSAYSGGWIDEVLMRFTDIVLSFPTLLFFLLILYIYGAGLGMFILVFSIFGWGGTARYVRSKALSVSEEEFIKASKISGASTYRVVRRHVIPNTASSIITQLTLLIPAFLLAEAQLSFLGIGEGNFESWGQLIAAGRDALAFAPWIVLVPGTALFLTILALNFLGDALLDALNPEAEAEADR